MVYKVEIKIGTHKNKRLPAPLVKWEATANVPYESLQIPQRYKLQRHLSATYGRMLAKTIMKYVYDYLWQSYDVYAWWEWGKKTAIICQNQKCFFQLSIQPTSRDR